LNDCAAVRVGGTKYGLDCAGEGGTIMLTMQTLTTSIMMAITTNIMMTNTTNIIMTNNTI